MQKRKIPTDKQKKEMILDYVECENYSKVAEKHGFSRCCVTNAVKNGGDIRAMIEEQQKQNSEDILEHMSKKGDMVCEMIDRYLEAFLDKQKIEKATPNQLSTALGTIIDKFTMTHQNEKTLEKLKELLGGIDAKF